MLSVKIIGSLGLVLAAVGGLLILTAAVTSIDVMNRGVFTLAMGGTMVLIALAINRFA